MLTDYHMHLQPDGVDARAAAEHRWLADGGPLSPGWIARYVERGRSRAIDEIAVTEHIHRFTIARDWHRDPFWIQEATEDIGAYVAALATAREVGMPVLIGIEMDWLPDRRDEIADVLAAHPFDIVLGSVHWLDDAGVDDPDRPAADVLGDTIVWDRYLEEFVAAARSGLYDVMAHPDLPKVFGRRLPPSMESRIGDVVAAVADVGVAIECSSAGLRKPVAEIYPDPDWLGRFAAAGVPVTLSSDAHRPEDVGSNYPTAVAALRGAGYTTLTRFRGREPRQEAVR